VGWGGLEPHLRVQQSPDGARGRGPLRLAGAGRLPKAFGYIAISYCQAGVPWGATGRRDAENRVQQEA
jgi:hypothetical protein